MTGRGATHQIACFNPPTDEERAAGRPFAPGFVRAAPPRARSTRSEPGTSVVDADDFEGLVADIQHEEGQISLAPISRRAAAPARAGAPHRRDPA